MRRPNSVKIVVFILVIGALMLAVWINYNVENLHSEANEAMIKNKCIGVVEEIDDNQASVYFIVDGEKYAFGNVGRFEMYNYVQVGDSITKAADSNIVLIKKKNGLEKTFVLK